VLTVSWYRSSDLFVRPKIHLKRNRSDEDRWITIGKDRTNNVIVVIHTFHEENTYHCKIRVISARKATKKETKQYEGDK